MVGQNNPDGIEPKTEQDTVAFTPYATIKDGFFLVVFCILFAWFVFYIPNFLGHSDNYIPANPAVTPTHIVPEWYYLPFYAILRAIPDKLLGVLALGASIVILAFLPVARYLEGEVGALSAALSAILLGVRHRLHRSRLAGLEAAGRQLRAVRAHLHGLLLRLLPAHPAGARQARERPSRCRTRSRNRCCARARRSERRRRRRSPRPENSSRHGPRAQDPDSRRCRSPASSDRSGVGARSADEVPTPPKNTWSFAGPFGKFDRAQLQRGFKVYREVCQVCHGLTLVAFRNLAEPGGPGLHDRAGDGDRGGISGQGRARRPGRGQGRPGRLADHFPAPFPNEQAARARYNAVPPDLSVIAKARGYERGFPGGCSTCSRSTRSTASTTSPRCCWATRSSRRPASRFRPAPSTTSISPATRSRCRRR